MSETTEPYVGPRLTTLLFRAPALIKHRAAFFTFFAWLILLFASAAYYLRDHYLLIIGWLVAFAALVYYQLRFQFRSAGLRPVGYRAAIRFLRLIYLILAASVTFILATHRFIDPVTAKTTRLVLLSVAFVLLHMIGWFVLRVLAMRFAIVQETAVTLHYCHVYATERAEHESSPEEREELDRNLAQIAAEQVTARARFE